MEDVLAPSGSIENQANTIPWADCVVTGTVGMANGESLEQEMSRLSDSPSDDDEYPKLQKGRGYDLRQKLSRTNTTADGRENDSSAVSPSKKQRHGGNDLRFKLSRGRGNVPQSPSEREDWRRPRDETVDQMTGRRQSGSGRPRYTERLGGLSPLRSPRTDKPHNILNLDNSHNYRFTKHMHGGSPSSAKARSYNGMRRGNRARHHNEETTVLSEDDDISDTEEGTPDFSRKSPRLDRTSWTRRRLQLPSEGPALEDLGEERLAAIAEEDEARLARREKDISYGKNTEAYRKYIQVVPRELRSMNFKKHPRTPLKMKKCSRRSWDGQIKIWKRRIHAWANDFEGISTETDKSETEGESSESGQTSYANVKTQGRTPTPSEAASEDRQEDTDDEVNLMEEEEEREDPESFLDSADIDFSVAHRVQEQVKLDDA